MAFHDQLQGETFVAATFALYRGALRPQAVKPDRKVLVKEQLDPGLVSGYVGADDWCLRHFCRRSHCPSGGDRKVKIDKLLEHSTHSSSYNPVIVLIIPVVDHNNQGISAYLCY